MGRVGLLTDEVTASPPRRSWSLSVASSLLKVFMSIEVVEFATVKTPDCVKPRFPFFVFQSILITIPFWYQSPETKSEPVRLSVALEELTRVVVSISFPSYKVNETTAPRYVVNKEKQHTANNLVSGLRIAEFGTSNDFCLRNVERFSRSKRHSIPGNIQGRRRAVADSPRKGLGPVAGEKDSPCRQGPEIGGIVEYNDRG